jgi:uncharacterized RDD family membrane protein YckC
VHPTREGPYASRVAEPPTTHRGARLGLEPAGPGSAAGLGRRLVALIVDCALSALMAFVFTKPHPPSFWSAVVLVIEYTFFVGLFGQTPGMRLLGIACLRVRDGKPIGLVAAAIRALLLQLLVPAVIYDQDGRGLHDKAAGSVVVRV